MDEKKEYELIQATGDAAEKKEYWDVAFGLQQVDNLEPSPYMYELAQRNIWGDLGLDEIEELLYSHYENETMAEKQKRTRECDLVSTRINEMLQSKSFTFSPVMLKAIHGHLFKGIYSHAGQYKTQNFTKREPILGGQTVVYGDAIAVEELLAYDFEAEKKQGYGGMSQEQVVKRISEFTSSIWQVHPFEEGNTRTTALFVEKYLLSLGFRIDNEPFKTNAKYFRNALVRSNFSDYVNGIDVEKVYLERFFANALFGKKYPLMNRDLLVADYFKKKEIPGPEMER